MEPLVHDNPEAPRTASRVDIISFSIIDWEFRYQRPQQIMSQFAANGHRVFYLSVSRFMTGPAEAVPGVQIIAENILEVQLACSSLPNVYTGLVDAGSGLLESLAHLREAYKILDAVAYVMIPSWADIALEARRLWGWTVAYDCMDEWENFSGIGNAVVAAEARLADNCDLLIVTAERLRRKWAARGRRAVLARNGVDYAFYSGLCRTNPLLADVPRPIVGYYGAIADWFDIDLLIHTASKRPFYSFVLVGEAFINVDGLKELSNVFLPGAQPYVTMPEFLYHFDACLIPFRINPVTEATDPVKLYEYLSGGKPVVATALPELESCREHVYIAMDKEDFVVQIDSAVAENDLERSDRRREFAASQTWSDRYRRISEGLAKVNPKHVAG
ncbi:MAG: glycosyltransferase [Bryobacteraceae bacterium]|nr:glycosyltransferase [Bryobacteraceae bacterium]